MYQSALGVGGTHDDMWQYADRIDVANRRYLAAIKTLAQVRRLQIPTLQIAMAGATQFNIGDKQVNMAGQSVNVLPVSFRKATHEAPRELSSLAPRCGAMTRKGEPCRAAAIPGKGRCRNHGGCSTGPTTEEGRERIRESNRRRAKAPVQPTSTAFLAD